jgi:ribose transport system permease protein
MAKLITEPEALDPEATSIPGAGKRASPLADMLAIPWVGVLGVILALAIFMTAKTGFVFLSADNLSSVALDFSYIAMAALGSAIVIIGGGIDLSVGANMGLSGLVTAMAVAANWPVPLAIGAGIGTGLIAGVLNATLITGIGLIPFIATLGTMSVFRGFATGIVSGQTVNAGNGFTLLGQGYVGPIPISALILVALTVLCAFFMNNTSWGRHIYAVGGSESAARLCGIDVPRVKWVMYILAALLGSIGGIVLASRLGSATPSNAMGYELICIAAAVIGGASLTGGEGTMVGVLVGAALLALIRNSLDILGWGEYWQDLIIGATIIVTVSFDQLRRRMRRV